MGCSILDHLMNLLKQNELIWQKYEHLFTEVTYKSKTTLLREGEIAKCIYFIKSGNFRLWYNYNGKDVTFQFFKENEAVSSIDSFYYKRPSEFNLEMISKPCTVVILQRDGFDKLINDFPELKLKYIEIISELLMTTRNRYLMQISHTPTQRYSELLKTNPQLIATVPHHYIASNLGITPISLSRIRAK